MTVDELRRFVLSLDGMTEKAHHGRPDFRLDGTIVVNLDEEDETITIKLTSDDQQALLARGDPGFTVPGGWARHGWTTISLRLVDDDEIVELVTDAWAATRTRSPDRTAWQ